MFTYELVKKGKKWGVRRKGLCLTKYFELWNEGVWVFTPNEKCWEDYDTASKFYNEIIDSKEDFEPEAPIIVYRSILKAK